MTPGTLCVDAESAVPALGLARESPKVNGVSLAHQLVPAFFAVFRENSEQGWAMSCSLGIQNSF